MRPSPWRYQLGTPTSWSAGKREMPTRTSAFGSVLRRTASLGRRGRGADSVFHNFAFFHVIDVADAEDEVGFFPRLVGAVVVVDGHFPPAHDFEFVAVDDDGGAFGEAYDEEVGVLFDDGNQVIPAQAGVDVLVDGAVLKVSEPVLVRGFLGHHDVGAGGIAAD